MASTRAEVKITDEDNRNANNRGTIAFDPPEFTFSTSTNSYVSTGLAGRTITLTASPKQGYQFVKWIVNTSQQFEFYDYVERDPYPTKRAVCLHQFETEGSDTLARKFYRSGESIYTNEILNTQPPTFTDEYVVVPRGFWASDGVTYYQIQWTFDQKNEFVKTGIPEKRTCTPTDTFESPPTGGAICKRSDGGICGYGRICRYDSVGAPFGICVNPAQT